jgi:hypothetical protein
VTVRRKVAAPKKSKSPIAAAMEPKVAEKFRNELEQGVAAQLSAAGIGYDYEGDWVHYTVPARAAKYLPDFRPQGSNIIIESKGHFGGGHMDLRRRSAEERHKLILLKEQHPELDIRIVFQRAATRIYPGSPTTNGQWATDHGFLWSDKGIVPPAWIIEIQKQQKGSK